MVAVAETAVLTGAEEVAWDLSEYYSSPTDPAIERDLASSLEAAMAFEREYRGRVGTLEPGDFAAMMQRLEEEFELSSRPLLYAHMLHTQDTGDPAAGRLMARVREAAAQRGTHTVFFDLELAAIDDAQAARIAADPEAARYARTVEEARKYRPHQLSELEERLLTDRGPVGAPAWTRLFEELCADVRVTIGAEEMNLAQALVRVREPDRETRRQASLAVGEALRRDIRTRAYIYNVIVQDHSIDDRQRGYPTWLSARNLANDASDDAVTALVQAVTARYGIVARYYDVKRRLLGIDRLHEWDRYAPVGGEVRQIAWSDARELVLGSYHRFSPRAGSLVGEFFTQPWIDARVTRGQEGGAYCVPGTPRTHPWVMMNFLGSQNDVLTLAHELGHGLHNRLASVQTAFDFHPPLTLAETASVFGETLTFDRMMAEESDPAIRLSLLCGQVEGAMATIFRQVAMNRFEDAVHTARRTEGELSVEQIGDLWQREVQLMFGESLSLTDDHRAWWSYVEHFIHTPGYVYAYAFGNLLALSIYRRYSEGTPGFGDAYLEFLSAGGSRRPDDLVRALGMEPSDPGFWDRGLDIVEEMVRQVEALASTP